MPKLPESTDSIWPRLYAIVDVEIAGRVGWSPLDLGTAYLAGGAKLLQLRAKAMESGPFLALASALAAAARHAGARLIVNDRADIAVLSGADGVHVGQDDLAPADVRRLVGLSAVVGLSTHSHAQIDEAVEQPISYLAVGPAFDTLTKDTGYDAVGLDLVRYAATRARRRELPVVAIGGITLARAPIAFEAGARIVAVIADLLSTGDPEARTRAYTLVGVTA